MAFMITPFLNNLWNLLCVMSPWILLGLLAAGLLKRYVSDELIAKHLGGNGFGAVLKASLYGLPLPLCSCGVLPLAASLKKSGASKGAISSFLISTPMTGVDSVVPTYAVFGGWVAFLRVVLTLFAALIAGLIVGLKPDPVPVKPRFSVAPKPGACGCDGSCQKPKSVLDYALNELLFDMAKPLLIGTLLAAALTTFLPESWAVTGWAGYAAVLLVALPLYVCSVSAIPLAAGLAAAGFSPGAAFLFLSAAPAVNIAGLLVLRPVLGMRALIITVASVSVFSLIGAVAIDLWLSDLVFGILRGEEAIGGWEKASAVLLTALMMWFVLFKKPIRLRGV